MQNSLFDIPDSENFQDRIRQLEVKMLPGANRKRDDPPMKALTKDEREEYADYLQNVKGQFKGADAFRNYVPPKPTGAKKKTVRGRKKKK